MAAGKRALEVAKTFICRSSQQPSKLKLSGLASSPSSSASIRRFTRVAVELGGGLSLMPLHSVTASALSTSLLSLTNRNWGCLSEGFATTL